MVTVFEHKSPHVFMELKSGKNVEFVDYTFMTDEEKLTKELKEQVGFNVNYKIVQEVEDRSQVQQKSDKKRGRPRINSGATATNTN